MQFSSSKQEPEKKTFKCYSCCFILPSLLTLTNLAYRLLFRYVNITIKPHAWLREQNEMTVGVFYREDPKAQLLLKALQGPRRSATLDRSHKTARK